MSTTRLGRVAVAVLVASSGRLVGGGQEVFILAAQALLALVETKVQVVRAGASLAADLLHRVGQGRGVEIGQGMGGRSVPWVKGAHLWYDG